MLNYNKHNKLRRECAIYLLIYLFYYSVIFIYIYIRIDTRLNG